MESSLVKKHGAKFWVFPDAEMPEVTEGKLRAHESIIILNLNKKPVQIRMNFYYTDKPPVEGINLNVEAERVRRFRLDNPNDIEGIVIEKNTQYAITLESDIEIVAQHGRLDTTQSNMAFYTVMGYCS